MLNSGLLPILHKADRDGWRSEDVLGLVAGKGPTLTLIKAAKSGYVFGAVTAVSWPKKPDAGEVTVADPSSTSFLFSLTNKRSHPFRLRLVDSSRALTVESDGSIGFGAQVIEDGRLIQSPNLLLFNYGAAANEQDSNFTNSPDGEESYGVDEEQWKGKRGAQAKPANFLCTTETFAGSQTFAAVNIEVFSI